MPSTSLPRSSRQAGIELLRVVALLMIITHHSLVHSGILNTVHSPELSYYALWGVNTFCFVAVNCFVLISGYFLITASFRWKKLLLLWMQVLFYSLLIFFVLYLRGNRPASIREIIPNIFPVLSRSNNWFATTYIALYLLFPFINIGIRQMTQKQLRACTMVLFAVFSVWPTVMHSYSNIDTSEGYGILWFICLYIFAAYLRLYVTPAHGKFWYLGGYVLLSAASVGFRFLLDYAGADHKQLAVYASMFYKYNSVLTLAASICLFFFFLHLSIRSRWISKVIIGLSGLTFGVYLIHDNPAIRQRLWLRVFKPLSWLHTPLLIPKLAGVVLGVFLVCGCIEWIRQRLFRLWENAAWFNRLCEKLPPLP